MRTRRAKSRTTSRYANVIEHLESRYLLTDLVGDTPATATDLGTLTAEQPFEIFGTIDEPFDLDVFQFQTGTQETATIELNANFSSLDTFVRLLDSLGNELAFDDDSGPGTNSLLRFTVNGGETYFVEAGDFFDGTGDFFLTISLDVGDTIATATDLGVLTEVCPVSFLGTIEQAADRDFFQFETILAGSATIQLSADFSSLDTIVTLFDSSGTQVATNDDFDILSTDSRLTFAVDGGETYFVEARGFSASTGDYFLAVSLDFGDTLATSTDLGLLSDDQPINVEGTIEQAFDRDVFQFQTNTSGLTLVELNADFSFLDTVVTVFDSSGSTILAFNDDIDFDNFVTDSRVLFQAEAGETYFVEARGLDDSTGGYFLRILPPVVPTDLGVLTDVHPVETTGTIELLEIHDLFLFTAEASGTVEIRQTASDSDFFAFDGVLYAFDAATGEPAAVNFGLPDTTVPRIVTFPVLAGQSYFAEIIGFAGSVGDYELDLSIQFVIGDTVGDTINDALDLGTLTAAQPFEFQSAIDQAFDRDVFQFQAEDSGSVLVELSAVFDVFDFDFLDTVVTVLDSSGTVISSNDDLGFSNSDSRLAFAVEANEIYFVEARGFSDSIGDYSLGLTLVLDVGDTIGTAQDLGLFTAGTPLEVFGIVDRAFDRDVFQIQSVETGMTVVELSAVFGLLDPVVTVFDSAGTMIASNDDFDFFTSDSRLSFSAEQGEVYFIEARGFGSTFGEYVLRLTAVQDFVGDTIATAENLGLLTDAQPLEFFSAIEFPFDRDVFQFQAEDSGSVLVELSAVFDVFDFDFLDTVVTVLDSSGTVILTNDDRAFSDTDSRLTFAVEANEIYFVEARGFSDSIGDYSLGLTLVLDVGDTFATAQDLGIFDDIQPLEVQGVIDQAFDRDVFRFQADASGSTLVDLAANFGFLDTFVTVFDSAGNSISSNNDSTISTTDSSLNFEMVQNETYFVEVRGVGISVGEYRLRLTVVANLGTLTTGQPIEFQDVIDPAFDRDLFLFQTDVSGLVVVALSAGEFSVLDTVVTVRDSTGLVVASNDDIDFFGSNTDSRTTFAAVAGETYTVEAKGFFSSVGAYTLRLTLLQDVVGDTVADAQDLGLLTTAQSLDVSGIIDQAFDRDVFQFQAATSGSVLVELGADFSVLDSLFLDTIVTVLDSAGNLIATNDDIDGDFFNTDSRLTFTAVAGEAYFVVAEGFSDEFFSSTGGYSLHIEFDVGFDPATATNLGTLTETRTITTPGTISAEEIRDLFLFTAATTGTVEVRQTAAPVTGSAIPLDGVLQAFRVDSGIPIATDFGSFDTTIPRVVTFSVVAGQSYFAEVTGFGGSVGRYQVQLNYVRDDVPAAGVDLAFTTGSRTIVRRGSIEVSGDIDTFRLVATNADRTLQIALNADSALGSFLDPILAVRIFANASATTPLRTLTNDDFGFSFNSFLSVPVSAGQRVEIDAKGFGTSRGAYVLTITSINGIAGATPLAAGTPVIGSIETPSSTDVFQFTPNVMGTAIIDVTSFDALNVPLGALGDPLVTIRETNTGTVVAFDDDSGPGLNSLATFAVTAGTSYDVVVGGFGSTTGNYRVTLNLVGGTDDGNTFAQATPVSIGSIPDRAIFSPTDVDVFSFAATFNGTLNVVVRPSDDSNLQAGLSVFQASPTRNLGDVELLEVSAPPTPASPSEERGLFVPVTQGRTYFFRVAGLNNTSGGYSLSVSAQVDRVAGGLPNDDLNAPQPGEIRIGANGQGSLTDPSIQSIDFPSDRDWYRVVAPASGVLTISLDRDFDYQDSILTVYNERGLPIARNDDSRDENGDLTLNSRLTLQAVRAGEVFFVEAADLNATPQDFLANPGRPRTYSVNVQFAAQATDDFGNDPGHIFSIPEQSSGRFTQRGVLEAAQDRDFFSFTAVVGGTFNVQLEGRHPVTNALVPLPPDVRLQVFEVETANVSDASLDNLTQIASITTSLSGQNGLTLSHLAVPRSERDAPGAIRNFVVVVSHVGTELDLAVNYNLDVNVDQGTSFRDLALQNAALFALLSLADGAAAMGDQNPEAINAAIQAAINELGKSGSFLVVLLDPINDPVLTDSAGRQTGFMSNTGTLNGVPGGYASVGSFGQVLIVPVNLSQPGSVSLQFAGVGSLSQATSSFSAFVVGPSGSAAVSQRSPNMSDGGKGNFVVQLGFGDTVTPIPRPSSASDALSPSFFMMTNNDRLPPPGVTTQPEIDDSAIVQLDDGRSDRDPEARPDPWDLVFWRDVLEGVLQELHIGGLSRPNLEIVLQRLRESDSKQTAQLMMNSSVVRSARTIYDVLKHSAGWFRSAKPTTPPAPKQRTPMPKVTQETPPPKNAPQARIASKKVTHLGG